MKIFSFLAFLVLSLVSLGQELPNAPSQVAPTIVIKPATFFTFGRFDADRPLRTNRQVLLSKTFLISHSIELIATVYDVEMTHQGLAHHKCVEANQTFGPHPGRSELYKDNLLVFGATSAFDFIFDKYVWRPFSLVSPTYASYVHFKGGTSWLRGGCW